MGGFRQVSVGRYQVGQVEGGRTVPRIRRLTVPVPTEPSYWKGSTYPSPPHCDPGRSRPSSERLDSLVSFL